MTLTYTRSRRPKAVPLSPYYFTRTKPSQVTNANLVKEESLNCQSNQILMKQMYLVQLGGATVFLKHRIGDKFDTVETSSVQARYVKWHDKYIFAPCAVHLLHSLARCSYWQEQEAELHVPLLIHPNPPSYQTNYILQGSIGVSDFILDLTHFFIDTCEDQSCLPLTILFCQWLSEMIMGFELCQCKIKQ